MPAKAIAKVATQPIETADREAQPNDITALLSQAVDKGIDADAMEKLLTLHERVADRMAAQEFARAMAAFQSECPFIPKSSTASIVTTRGSSYAYSYAELPEICKTIKPFANKHGLSYTWDTEETTDSQLVCICIVRHVNGHQVPTRFKCPIDTTAKMSGPQKSGAALTYAKRQSVIAAFGLTTCDPDDYGAGGTAAFVPIAPDQVAGLEAAIKETGASMDGFLSYFHIKELMDLPVDRLDEATRMLSEKKRQQAEGGQS